MPSLSTYEHLVISCLLWLSVAPRPLRSEFHLAYVSDQNLYMCLCEREQPHCSEPDASTCDCKDYPLSQLQRSEGSDLVHHKRITIWYSSPTHVALLLHNAEVRHLTLIKCNTPVVSPGGAVVNTDTASSSVGAAGVITTATGIKLPSLDQFVVKRLENLTVWPSACPPGPIQDLLLGKEMGAGHNEQTRIAIFDTAALAGVGKPCLRAYTVLTKLDADGLLPFPNLHVLPNTGLPDFSNIFVTFLY